MAIVRMLYVALRVTETARSVAFYRDMLGFEVVGEVTLRGAETGRALGVAVEALDAVLLERDGFRMELLRTDASVEHVVPTCGLSHLALAVDDLATTLHSLRDRGVTIEAGTLTELAPGVATCVIRDPDGFPIVLSQAPSGVASPWGEDG